MSSHARWTDEERAVLRQMFAAGDTFVAISAAMPHRSPSAVRCHANEIGLVRRDCPRPVRDPQPIIGRNPLHIDAIEGSARLAAAINRMLARCAQENAA